VSALDERGGCLLEVGFPRATVDDGFHGRGLPQQRFHFLPLPQGHGALRPTFTRSNVTRATRGSFIASAARMPMVASLTSLRNLAPSTMSLVST
jgi:hypothetical protein